MENERRAHLKGYLLAAAAAVLWGLSGVVTKYLLRRQMRPDELLVLRTSIAAAILVAWLGLKSPQLLNVRRSDLLPLILLGAIGLALNQCFYYLSLMMVSVGYSLLLQYLAPVHLMVYGVLSKTERMTGGKIAAAFTAICGCALMILGQEGGIERVSLAGTLFAIGSGVCFAFYSAYGKQALKSHDPGAMITYAFLTSAVVAASVAWLWLDEKLEPMQIAGGAAVVGGVLILQIESLTRAKALQ